MRRIITPLLTFLTLIFVINTAEAQLFEDFESGEKLGYTGGAIELETGEWYLEDALIRSDGGSSDLKNGALSVRIRDGYLRMNFNKSSGADELSFYAGNSGFSGDGGGVLQVYYSIDDGSGWEELGDPISLTDDLEKYTLPVEVDGDIRIRINKTDGGRVNVDDVRITDYITPADDPTIAVNVDGENVSSGDLLSFSATPTGSSRMQTVTITNLGNPDLTITEVSVQGAAYTISDNLADSTLSFKEKAEVTLTFAPESEGILQGQLLVESNAVNESSFSVNISGEGFADDAVIPIADAREVEFGTRVTVAGRVTVANEFGGPAHIQDNTAAIAVYWPPLHTTVERGDSVIVTGPVTEFNPVDGPQGDFLLQIAEHDGDDDITFDVLNVEKREVQPELITIDAMNSGNYEAQLVVIENVTVDHSGSFQGESNYDISDGTGQATIRIDGDADLVGVEAPSETTTIVGVVDQFFGDYQLKPRSADDLGAEAITYPGDDISKDETFEVVTWNIEWFGDENNGPDDDEQQFTNVMTVLNTIDAEIYALQEISNVSLFNALIDSLENYGGFLADFTQSQKTAYLFKRSEIDSLSSGKITQGMTSNYWAGGNSDSFARFPLMFHFNANVNNETREIYAFNIHAKAMDDSDSYNQRVNASRELKAYLDQAHPDDNVIFLGDYNDTVMESITNGEESPYKIFMDDNEYTVITYSLQERGFGSQSRGSMIDHISITSELSDEYFEGTERIENTNYIGSYLSTTSDHYPVWVRFEFEPTVSNEEELNQPLDIKLAQNYPNPFNPTTNISYQLAENSVVSLKVYDMLGREVASLVNNARLSAGNHEVTFDASELSSGMYIYQLRTSKGQQLTRKMMLIK